MKHLMLALGLVALLAPGSQAAGKIERACMKADRRDASRQLCGCVQNVAEAMFNRSEISRIAKFFDDPHATQTLRQSDRNSDERFWKRYKEYGQAVRTYCAN